MTAFVIEVPTQVGEYQLFDEEKNTYDKVFLDIFDLSYIRYWRKTPSNIGSYSHWKLIKKGHHFYKWKMNSLA